MPRMLIDCIPRVGLVMDIGGYIAEHQKLDRKSWTEKSGLENLDWKPGPTSGEGESGDGEDGKPVDHK